MYSQVPPQTTNNTQANLQKVKWQWATGMFDFENCCKPMCLESIICPCFALMKVAKKIPKPTYTGGKPTTMEFVRDLSLKEWAAFFAGLCMCASCSGMGYSSLASLCSCTEILCLAMHIQDQAGFDKNTKMYSPMCLCLGSVCCPPCMINMMRVSTDAIPATTIAANGMYPDPLDKP